MSLEQLRREYNTNGCPEPDIDVVGDGGDSNDDESCDLNNSSSDFLHYQRSSPRPTSPSSPASPPAKRSRPSAFTIASLLSLAEHRPISPKFTTNCFPQANFPQASFPQSSSPGHLGEGSSSPPPSYSPKGLPRSPKSPQNSPKLSPRSSPLQSASSRGCSPVRESSSPRTTQ